MSLIDLSSIRLQSGSLATMVDPRLRGSSELLHQIRSKALTLPEIETYCKLLWAANTEGIVRIEGSPTQCITRLEQLVFLARTQDPGIAMLNPHVAQIGNRFQRGRLRNQFRKLLEA